jgi:hypothetical protein
MSWHVKACQGKAKACQGKAKAWQDQGMSWVTSPAPARGGAGEPRRPLRRPDGRLHTVAPPRCRCRCRCRCHSLAAALFRTLRLGLAFLVKRWIVGGFAQLEDGGGGAGSVQRGGAASHAGLCQRGNSVGSLGTVGTGTGETNLQEEEEEEEYRETKSKMNLWNDMEERSV